MTQPIGPFAKARSREDAAGRCPSCTARAKGQSSDAHCERGSLLSDGTNETHGTSPKPSSNTCMSWVWWDYSSECVQPRGWRFLFVDSWGKQSVRDSCMLFAYTRVCVRVFIRICCAYIVYATPTHKICSWLSLSVSVRLCLSLSASVCLCLWVCLSVCLSVSVALTLALSLSLSLSICI